MKALAQIPRGETIKLAGYEWLVLEHRPEDFVKEVPAATLVLMGDILENRAFDKDNSNDWRKSSSREYLNGEFLGRLADNLAPGQSLDHILEADIDLTAEDGLKDYGTTTDSVFLLTCDQYRRHRDIIEPLDDWWWTLTPYSTPSASNSYDVRYVNSGGTLGSSSAYNGSRGLRPALLLDSVLSVSLPGDDEQPEQEDEPSLEILARAVRAVASHYGLDPDELARIATELGKALAEVGTDE